MIDGLIKRMANLISGFALPSTILKLSLIALIVSLPLSLILGSNVIIFVLVVSNIIWTVTEYLYTKQEEDENLTDSSD